MIFSDLGLDHRVLCGLDIGFPLPMLCTTGLRIGPPVKQVVNLFYGIVKIIGAKQPNLPPGPMRLHNKKKIKKELLALNSC